MLISSPLYFDVLPAQSSDPRELTFGEQQTTNIFPTSAHTDDWGDVEKVLTQDLSDHALYQDFSEENSASISEHSQEIDRGESFLDTASSTDVSQEPVTEVQSSTEAVETIEATEPSSEMEESASELPVSLFYEPPFLEARTFEEATKLYPLAHLVMTSSTEDMAHDHEVIEESVETDTVSIDDQTVVTEPVVDNDQTVTFAELSAQDTEEVHQLTLENFSVGSLEPGHFVDAMQLRLSFAANPVGESSPAPYVDVFFGDDGAMRQVGYILLDEEASNAINGGYYLFALPAFMLVDELDEAKVVIRYHGTKAQVEDVFVDAAWLEMTTRIITAEDLEERGTAEQLTHLDAPDISVLLSDQLNFDVTDEPLFNLRYETQQNFLVRGFLKLIGKGSFGVKSALIIHETLGEIDVTPEVTVANDGLITVKIPESENEKMPPGTYMIALQFDENGSEYTDTFDFQWGLLALNPHKSEYEVGETAKISMGALSPNGNTLCDANLQFYITDPTGAVSKAPVIQSGKCHGNNVTDTPDFTAEVPVTMSGDHELYLERLDEQGKLVGFITDSFKATDNQAFSIERNGPTRIYPVSPYVMELKVHTDESFAGVVKERVPASFIISSTTADITQEGEYQILSWDISTMSDGTDTVSYGFDAPDISPYIYELGSAWIENTKTSASESTVTSDNQSAVGGTASSTEVSVVADNNATTSTETTVVEENHEVQVVFAEHRQWQIASDATGSMILMWDGGTIPTGWTCVSCTAGDPFYQRFIVGSSTPGNNGGAATHTHTATAAVAATGATGVSNAAGGGTDAATLAHTHTLTPTIGTANNLPSYRNLVIIQNNSAGEPTSIPTGAIAMFDTTVPTGWTQYAAQNGFYVRGESVANRTTTGGSNTHTHTITGTLSGPTGTTNAAGSGSNVATQAHTHTISSNTAAESSEPPYIETILGKLNATTTMPDNAITMWTDSQPSGWTNVSTTSTAFNNRFFKPAATYGTTGGATTHTPANVNGITTSAASASNNRQTAGTSDAPSTHTHSVNVTGFTSASILPPYRSTIFAKRAGGMPPDAPTVHELFDHEKTGTSTPEFEFTANDPYGTDTLVYEFQWDDDSDLDTSPLGDRTSDVETGCSPNCFINTVNGGDTNPFTEAERIRFTIQTPLTDGVTYYYRVRAKKTIGGTYGSWSETYSFTHAVDTDPSQWMQTQDSQFAKNVFSSAETFGSDSVRIQRTTPVEVLVAYGEGAVTTPRYRIWDGSAWGAEASATSVGGTIQWIKTAAATTRDEYVLATQDAVNDINVQVFNGTTDTWGSVTEVTTAVSDNTRRGMDVAYETTSGDAMIVYCDGDSNPSYRVWNGSSWSAANTITTTSANNCNYIELASDPISDEIIVVTRDTGAGYEAQVWNGSAWGNAITLGSMSDTAHEGISAEYEESGGQGVVVVSNGGTNGFIWTSWNGTEWGTATTYTLGDDFEWGVLKRDIGTDNMALCYIDNDADIGVIRWDGDAWQSSFTEIEVTGNIFDGRAVSCEFETSSGRDGYIMVPYSDTGALRYQFWNGSSYSAEASISTILDSWTVSSVRAGDGKVLAVSHDDTNTQYDFSYWNGSTWSAIQTLETSPSVTANPRREPIEMAAKIYQPSTGSVTSDPIPFSLVPGRPTWGEAVWSTTEPSGTNVLLQVMYATTTYCNTPVPNGSLPGNAAGFDVSSSPLDLSGLSTTTYSSLCLKATLSTSNTNMPTLDDWTLSWERQPFLVQSQFRWYANANWINPSDAWPAGATDLLQNEAIPQAYSTGAGDIVRLRMAVRSDNAPLVTTSKAFKLQYAEQSGSCASTTDSSWYDVGAVGSTTAAWRGYNNLLAFDGSTISTLLLTGSDVGGTYEEENDSDDNPNAVSVGNEAEWDWALEQNTALDGVVYCFRMVNDEGTSFSEYEQYPSVLTNASPQPPSLEKLFDNEQVASTSPWFEFAAQDAESDDVSYQIQVDDTYDFSSTVLDRNSFTNLSEFENIVVPANKDPFTAGQTVRFKPSSALSNNTTYYWRVRGKDVDGSNEWGEWSTVYSFTIDTTTTVTTWYQTTEEQFDTDTNINTETTGSDDLILTSGQTFGTTTTNTIDFDSKTAGNAWGELSWNHNVTNGTLRYRVEYFTNGNWELVPDSFLPSNATGFTSSPVSLLSLDPEVHNEIRLRADFTDVGGTPRLLDWKLAWGYAVEQPTQITLFDNEKTGTTTPSFTFTTTDPDSDDIQYEFSWSTDPTFTTGVNVATSGVSAGFSNVDVGIDTSPFFSGDTINYKMQSALSNGTTYWWKVRGRDPSGGNAWSVWSATHSFTIDTSVTVSTWFQTTDEQFATDALSDTETTGSDGVEIASIIREAMVAYAEGTVQTPRYRIWNGTTWSTESSAVSVGGSIRFVETAASQTRDEYIVATQENAGRVRAQVYDGSTDTFGDLQTIVAAVPGLTSRGYDIAYETTSGDALVVACNGTEATYSVWDGSSWSGASAITLAVTANCNWIELASDPASDEIILVVRDATTGVTDYQALVWNGSTWGNSMTLGSMNETTNEGIAVEYEESGNQAVVVVSNGTGASFAWNSWNGSAWSGAATQADQDDFENGRLTRDVGTDNLALCSIDQDGQIKLFRWTGSSNSWNAYTTIDTVGNSKTGRPAGCIYETTVGRDGYIMVPYSDTTDGRYQFWNGSALSGEATVSSIQDSQDVQSIRTGDGNILTMFYDDINTQYDFSYWNGTAWSTFETLETSAITTTIPPTMPISMAARKFPTFTSGSVESSAIDFDEGSGLKWQSATFSDTTPGSSDILYQLEFWDGDSWELIPNSALAGNSTGFSTSPIDLSQLSRITYNTIRMVANLNCVGGNCPTLNDWSVVWAEGIIVSGTTKQYNQTASTTSGTVAVAVNGVIQAGKTATISNGAWSIPNVRVFEGDIVTVFVTGAADSAEAIGVTRYDGDGDITGITMFERHLVLGSNDATTTPMTNADIGLYDFTSTEDIFFNGNGNTLAMCATTGCADVKLYVKSNVRYVPGGRFVTHDFQNYGYFTAGTFTHEVNGSWDNNATSTMTGSTIVFAATSTTESVDSTGATVGSFNNVTFGTTTGSGVWTLPSTLDVDGTLTVSRGTLARGTTPITLGGSLVNGANGVWTGLGTTTFDGGTAVNWSDLNGTKQNVGNVLIDGSSKAVTLSSNVAAQSITIGSNDTLDASASNFDITVYANWLNQNNFVARGGEVFFAATTTGKTITTAGDAFFDLTFSGSGGGWSFTESTVSVGNDFKSNAGTVTLPTATTTVTGSFTVTSGTFGHNNGTLLFNSSAAETITFAGGAFTNVANNLWFQGTGNWTVTDTNATSTNDVRVQQGTLNFPSGVFAIGGTLRDTGGSYNGGTGTVAFYSATAEILTAGGSSFNNVTFAGAGSWSFSDTNVTASRNVTVNQGTLTLPSGTFSIAGSYDNNATVIPGTGTVLFNSTDTGETVAFGSSSLYNVWFNHAGGGWTISENGTSTNNFSITSVNSLTLTSGRVLAVGGVFTNSVGGSATTWTGSTLSLTAGNYSLNTKSATGDQYGTLKIGANTDVAMWNSSSTAYSVDNTGSLYSQDHSNVNGDLYIWGSYARSSGTEYWSYTNDFDGTALGGSPRQVDVRFASGASAVFTSSNVNITGISTASTTIANQGSGTYTVSVTGGSLNAQYYQFADLGSTGLSLLGATSVPSLRDGSFTVGVAAGTAITLSSTTIDASPAKQIYNVTFSTTTAIAATNVSQTDGAPSSFWWFRSGHGNLYGEAKDNDTGNPGSVRFDDSSLLITVSGTVFSDDGGSPIIGGTCDGATSVVRVVVNGGTSYTGSCSNVDGTYSIPGVAIIGDPTLTIYLDGASGGQRGSVITRTPTADIIDADIYANRVIVRNEDIDALTIENLAVYDFDNDTDLRFTATNTSLDTLNVMAGNELYVFATSTFTPGGVVTLAANAGANSYDGTLYINNGATFNAYATSTLTIGGRLVLDTGAVFDAASSTVLMNATTSGKSITSSSEITFNELVFNGVGGSWNIGADIEVLGDMTITAGTVTGTGDIALPDGSITGNGILSLGAGTTTIARSNTLGGTSAWTFYNLQLGSGLVVGTTTPVFTSTTTVAGRLTISAAHFLDAGATNWYLSGTGTVFVESGTFLEDTSTIRYSGAGANVLASTYYNLDLNSGAGSQTYTGTGVGILVNNDLTIGGSAASSFNLTTIDPTVEVNGDVVIRGNGTISASDTDSLTIGGSYTNNGTFTSNNGTVVFDGTGTIAAGASSFANVTINTAGSITVSQHATATAAWRLLGSSAFTLASGQSLAVGGTFFNAIGSATTWTGSTLRLYGNGNYSINAATTSDSYATLSVDGTTQIRMWNSDASTYDIDSTASLYSQDHANVAGDLNIYGSYRRTSGGDYWAYATDFDGTALGGGARKVDVFIASGGSVSVTGGSLFVQGASSASTTLQNQGSGTYGITIGGNASTSWQYYEVTDTNSSGLVFTSAPTITTLSNGNFEVSQNGGSAITVGGSVITANPAKNFNLNRFALDGVGSGFNVTATGTTVSAWRFVNHYGDIDGETNDVDPGGDPGYIAWDDSDALITVGGNVYSDEGSTVSSICDGTTNNVTLRIAGITSYSTSCNASTGAYTIPNIAYGSSDSLVVYIDGETEKGANITQEPVSNITDMHIYENRVIVRHESTNPISIVDFTVWDSSDDGDIPFTAVDGSPDTLTLPANRKLIVWAGKEFEPNGNVTISGGGAGGAQDGTLQLSTGASWTGQGTESLAVGGSMILDAGANFVASNGTTTFTTTGSSRTIDVNEDAFHHVAFTGVGSWTITDAIFTANGNVSMTNGTLDLPTGTSTFNGSLINNGGAFDANGGVAYFNGGTTHTLRTGGSWLAETIFSGGTYTMTDTNATSTGSVTIESGTVSLPSGIYAVDGDFENLGGAITHNTSELVLTNPTSAVLTASSSDLHAVTFSGGGSYEMTDDGVTFLDDLRIINGSDVALASGTISIGGSFLASGGTFSNSTTTILFNSADGGEVINPGVSEFYAVQVSAPTGGYTLAGSATTTHNFTLSSANSFATQSGVVLRVEGVFTNYVGGSNTNWNGSTLVLDGANAYTINTKVSGGDRYNTLQLGADSDVRMWNSSATTTTVSASASLYSQDHGTAGGGSSDGILNIYGDFHVSTSTEYWSYATDFDGATLVGGSRREVIVLMAQNATTTVDGGSLQIVGESTNETTLTNQGVGTYAFAVSGGTFNAQYYAFRNLNTDGLSLTGTPTVTSLSYGDFELAVNGGTLITLASSTLNANASKVITGNRFATTTAISGTNVALVGATTNAWTFVSHTGNLDGEAFDDDGGTTCGSIRWNDSACLITQQTNYRWRNDDGGLNVPNSEWYNSNWDSRKSVRINNEDATTYTDAVVEILVDYDSDMQVDFDDLRFTRSDGTTLIPHWVGSSTASDMAEVWVKLPSLPAEDMATIFMYYNNPSATTSSSAEDTFIAADDFEDGDVSEYSGQTSLFSASSLSYDGAYGLEPVSDTDRANLGGIYRLDQTVSQGETFRFQQYIDTAGSGDEICTKFGIQSPGSANDNYAVCVELQGTDRIVLARDVVENDSGGGATVLDSANITFATGWYEFEVEWGTDDSIGVVMYDDNGATVDTLSASDGSYTSGGIGFTFWYNLGGWDSVSSRPTLLTEPTALFGAEQGDGGASWKASQNTAASYEIGDIARLRIAVENSGTTITGQEFLLEYAALGAAPSCEAVIPASFATVPVQSSCGSSPVCMQSSSLVTNGAATGDLLTGVAGSYVLGQLREDPSNITSAFDVNQDSFTELEYVITPTTNTVDESLCFRVTDNGTDYDTYLQVARLDLAFAPDITNVTLNDGFDISLIPGTTTRVYATGTVTDLNGGGDLKQATSTFYRSGVGAACTPDNNNCYISECSFENCSGNSCEVSCYADMYFHTDATATSSEYDGEEWFAFVEAIDYASGYDFETSIGKELNLLRAIGVDNAINYGSLAVGQDTGSSNASTTVDNQGNTEINLEIEGSDMTDGYSSVIPVNEQKFATTTFTYSGCSIAVCNVLSAIPFEFDVDLLKPTTHTPPTSEDIYWGVEVPTGVNSAPHSGINVFTPVSP